MDSMVIFILWFADIAIYGYSDHQTDIIVEFASKTDSEHI